MRFKRILPKILLIAGFLALYLILKYQTSIKEFWSFNLEKIKIYFDNFFSAQGSGLERHRPLSLIEKETELKLYVGQPFIDFSQKDWREFWNLIYGVFPEKTPEKPGLPKRVRQLTTDETAFELMSLYPNPFSYFKEEHWRIIFSIILRK